VREALGDFPVMVEDLGLITPPVHALRKELGFPGMKVLQFAFGGYADNPYLPHNHVADSVVYTGTHDNDTTRGWYENSEPHVQDHVRRYFGISGRDIAWDMIRAALASVADMAIIPVQDVLDLGTDARMNFPGHPLGNWGWRLLPGQLTRGHAERLGDLVELYERTEIIKPEDENENQDPTAEDVQ
jgi:4-alpha-glucanotransferase